MEPARGLLLVFAPNSWGLVTAEAEEHHVLRGQGAGLLLANLAEAIAAMTIVKWGQFPSRLRRKPWIFTYMNG